MITLNGKPHRWERGITVEELLKIKKYTYPRITVKVNGKSIEKEEYSSTIINDQDIIQVIHLLAGG